MTRRLHSSRATTFGAVFAALIALLGGVAVAGSGSSGAGSGAGAGKGLVITAEALRRTLTDSVTVKGALGRVEQRQIVASAASHASAVHIEDGTEVKAGDPILALDGRDAVAVPGTFPFFRALDVGAQGEDVRQLEKVLESEGFHPGKVDSVYTAQTRSALAQWQAAHHYPGAAPERAKTVTVSLTPSSGYTVGERSSAGVTIQPAAPGVRAASSSGAVPDPTLHAAISLTPHVSVRSLAASTPEGAPAVFRIDADDTSASDMDITLALSGTAGTAADVVAPAGTVKIPAGSVSVTVSIPTRQDSSVEGDEGLLVSIVAGAGYLLGTDPIGTTTIIDDDLPELRLSGSTTLAEGDTGVLTVVADQPPVRAMQVVLSTTGDATPGKDYRSVLPVVTFPAGALSVTFPVNTLTDDVIENDERVVVSLAPSAGNYRVGPSSVAVVTITQATADSALPIVTLRPTATHVKEGVAVPATVSIDRPLVDDLVLLLTYTGTAVLGEDYAPLGRVVIPAGQTSLALQIPTVQDDRVEPDKVLTVGLTSGRYLLGSPSTASITIESDDLPKLTLLGDGGSISQGGGTTFTIVADQAPTKDISVTFSAVGTATPGQDFDALVGSALLRAGETTLVVPLLTIDDNVKFQPNDMVVGTWPIRVGQVFVKEGASVAPGAPLLSLTDSGLTVTLHASASDRTRLKAGQKVKVTLSGGTDTADGVISKLDETAKIDEKTKEQYYEGTVDVGDLKAADGANVSIEVILDQRDDALTVPIAAVKQNGSGKDVVRVLDLAKGGVVREVPVTTGITEGSYIEVRTGLKGGEVVIVEVDAKK